MTRPPLILVSPNIEKKGDEFGDLSISLSETYQQALMACGAIPLPLAATTSRELIAECVCRCDGVLLTGGEDVDPRLYGNGLPPRLRGTVTVTPDKGARDVRELTLIDEVFRQRKPLLGICRGQQMLNVALGGALVVDIPAQIPNALAHNDMARKTDRVHSVRVSAGSMLAKITGATTLGVNSTHHQAVSRVGEGLCVVARSGDGVIEALELKDPGRLPFLLTVQFHPERMLDGDGLFLRIFESFVRAAAQRSKKNL